MAVLGLQCTCTFNLVCPLLVQTALSLSWIMQGNVYDDDEEYGDTLDDGADDGAVY